MTPEARQLKIESYGKAYETLIAGVRQFPEEMWDFRDEHGCWSIREHLAHIADSEANSYIRCRRFIAEPGQPLMAYDENGWAASLGYPQQDTETVPGAVPPVAPADVYSHQDAAGKRLGQRLLPS